VAASTHGHVRPADLQNIRAVCSIIEDLGFDHIIVSEGEKEAPIV
jgi:hypothetical protein